MASGYGVPVRFTKEKNVWDIFGKFNIGSGGALNVATVQTSAGPQFINKGIANIWQNTPTFSAVTSSGSSTITSVSSFFGLFSGMSITNSNIAAGLTVGTISAATGSIILNGTGAAATGFTGSTGALFVAAGGQYIFQFGVNTSTGSISQFSRLDTYNRLLNYNVTFEANTSSSLGTAIQQQLFPSGVQSFIVSNSLTTKTVPATATSNSTDASLLIQFGNSANGFTPAILQAGTVMKLDFCLGNTTGV